jgi:hypothetical protein
LLFSRFAHIGLADKPAEQYIKSIQESHSALPKERILGTKVLIIDEISMISAKVLDLIERVCREVRPGNLPFGGIKVLFFVYNAGNTERVMIIDYLSTRLFCAVIFFSYLPSP